MPCYKPLKGWQGREMTKNGKYSVVFNPRDGYIDKPIQVPCGQCIGCRLERSRQWAIRCVHEASMHKENCFITLTYANEHLPTDSGLCMKHFQSFMKALRKKIYPVKVKFFHCGEYGEKYSRPHYHAIIFGYDFGYIRYDKDGSVLYDRRDKLAKLWKYGHTHVGNVTFDSCAYVARYILKKITGENAEQAYKGKKPEYVTMSRKPGIGNSWFKKFGSEVYPSDTIVMRGREMLPPKYYDGLYEIQNKEGYQIVKTKRSDLPEKVLEDNGELRLRVKERVAESYNKLKNRSIEHGKNIG